jgi:outer membrane protein TolC
VVDAVRFAGDRPARRHGVEGQSRSRRGQASLRQARQNYLATAGGLQPQVDAKGGIERQRQLNAGDTFDLFSASVDVSYAVDVFGGLRRGLEAQGAVEENTRFELEATYLSLISNVVVTAIQQASLRAQIASQMDIINAQQQQLDLSEPAV